MTRWWVLVTDDPKDWQAGLHVFGFHRAMAWAEDNARFGYATFAWPLEALQ